jgi:ribosomal protein L40E
MPNSKTTCPECGAVVPERTDQCGLCGTDVPKEGTAGGVDTAVEAASSSEAASEGRSEEGVGETAEEGMFCNQCGWQNPPGANFCSRCGHELQSPALEEPPPGTKPAAGPPDEGASPPSPPQRAERAATPPSGADDGLAQRVAWVVGIAALLVAGLYGWSTWSETSSTGSSGEGQPATAGGPPAMAGGAGAGGSVPGGAGTDATASDDLPDIIKQQQGRGVPAAIAARADSLQRATERRSGQAQQQARRELARLFAGVDSTNRAATHQWQLAQQTDATTDWERVGSLLYDWMAALDRGRERTQVARLAVDAYQRVLRDEPNNHDVRTNLAVAYLDTNNPMRGISEIKRVLSEAPDHVGARFNYGLMQVMIGRNATALEQFERVREAASQDSRYYQQAGQLIQRIKKQADGEPQDAPMPGQDGGGRGSGSLSVGAPGS